MSKLLTTIMPIYNTEKYLERSIKSLDHKDIQIIAIDDGSTDKSLATLYQLQRDQSNLKILKSNHQGAVNARRIGMQYVNTPYFSFVDSDDAVRTEEYVNLCKTLSTKNISVGVGRLVVYLPNFNVPLPAKKQKKSIINFSKEKNY